MKIILTNGTELNPILAMGGKQSVQGVYRDILTFVFPESASMDELDALFIETNCESIKIMEDSKSEYVHKGYTVRAALKREEVEVEAETEESAAVYENRVFVSMGQRTYSESQIASLTETVDVLVMESLMA